MRIKYKIDDGVFESSTLETLQNEVLAFHAQLGIAASAKIEDDAVVVDRADIADIDADEDTRIIVMFCNNHRFGKAHKVLGKLIAEHPADDNAHRLLAQVMMEEGKIDSAIEECKVALRLNPRSEYALILMGNLLSRDKDLLPEGVRYYRRVMLLKPDSALAVCNYAATLMQIPNSDEKEIERLLKKAIGIDPHLLTAYYALSHLHVRRMDPWSAFEAAQAGLRMGMCRPENPEPIREKLLGIVLKLAPTLCSKGISPETTARMKELGERYGVPFQIEVRDDLAYPLCIERAENHQRDYHLLVYNPTAAGGHLNHLICLALEKEEIHRAAKSEGNAKRIGSGENHFQNFTHWVRPDSTGNHNAQLREKEEEILRFMHHGLVSQLTNCVLDAIVERRLFNNLPKLRPAQFLSDLHLAAGIVQSAQLGKSGEFPDKVVSATRTMGLFSLFAYRDIVGIEMSVDVDAPKNEYRMAADIFAEFIELEKNYKPGDEWRLVADISKKLGLDNCCEIVPDDDRASLYDEAMKAKSKVQAREASGVDASNEGFLENNRNNPAIGMSVMFFMVDAIRQLREMTETRVRRIAFQIATMGISGISPGRKSGYRIAELPGKDMSGCQALAWYYASWRIGFPDKIGDLEKSMPFGEQYLQALHMVETGNGDHE